MPRKGPRAWSSSGNLARMEASIVDTRAAARAAARGEGRVGRRARGGCGSTTKIRAADCDMTLLTSLFFLSRTSPSQRTRRVVCRFVSERFSFARRRALFPRPSAQRRPRDNPLYDTSSSINHLRARVDLRVPAGGSGAAAARRPRLGALASSSSAVSSAFAARPRFAGAGLRSSLHDLQNQSPAGTFRSLGFKHPRWNAPSQPSQRSSELV